MAWRKIGGPNGAVVIEKEDDQEAYDQWELERTTVVPKRDAFRKWRDEISLQDGLMSRRLEDHLESDHDGSTSNVRQQAAYDEKKRLRGIQPVDPDSD